MHHDTPRRRGDGPEGGHDGHDGHDDLAWLAWRYLLGELDPVAAAVFEERLGDDEEAAAALARGVVLLSAIEGAARPVGRVRPTPTGRRWRRRRGMGLAALTAAVGLVCLLGIGQRLDRAGAAGDAIELVSMWREAAVDASADGESVGMEDDGPPVGDDVPDWLVAAVVLDAPATDDEILEN